MSIALFRSPSLAARSQLQVATAHALMFGCAIALGSDALAVNLMLALELCAVLALELLVDRKRRWSERIATLLSAVAVSSVVMAFGFVFYLASFPEPWMPAPWNGELPVAMLASRSMGVETVAGGLLFALCLLAWPLLAADGTQARSLVWRRHQGEGMVT